MSTEILGTLVAKIEKRRCRASRDGKVIWDPFDDMSIQTQMKPLRGPQSGCEFVHEDGLWYGIKTVHETVTTSEQLDVALDDVVVENQTLKAQVAALQEQLAAAQKAPVARKEEEPDERVATVSPSEIMGPAPEEDASVELPSAARIRRMSKKMLIDLAQMTDTDYGKNWTNARIADTIISNIEDNWVDN